MGGVEEVMSNVRDAGDAGFDFELLDRLLLGSGSAGSDAVTLAAPEPSVANSFSCSSSFWSEQENGDEDQNDHGNHMVSSHPTDAEKASRYDLFNLTQNNAQQPTLDSFLMDASSAPGDWFTTLALQTADRFSLTPSPLATGPSVFEAIRLNRELQGQVSRILASVGGAASQHLDAVDAALDELTAHVSQKSRRSFTDEAAPITLSHLERLVSQTTREPLPFAEIRKYCELLKTAPNWSAKERDNLRKGVLAENERLMLGLLRAHGLSVEEAAAKMGTLTDTNDLLTNVKGLDWLSISEAFVQTRGPDACRLQWTAVEHPLINHQAMGDAELAKLSQVHESVFKRLKRQSLPAEYRSPWQWIASELETNRTAFDCFAAYQRKLNKSLHKGKWSFEEDERLREAVHLIGQSNWTAVAELLDGRTGQQCLHRWEKALNPVIKRGRWTAEEDELLREAVQMNNGPGNWTRIKTHIPGRTDVQCRERWVNVLNPALTLTPFTPNEDAELLRLVKELGTGKWAQIAGRMSSARTDNQLWRRWKRIGAPRNGRQSRGKKDLSARK
jgi:hypothetical protein